MKASAATIPRTAPPGRSVHPWRRGALALAIGLAFGTADAAPAPPSSPSAPAADDMGRRALACTGCHGDQGRADPAGYVPRIAGKPAGYLFTQLQAFRDGRRTHAPMARLLEWLDDGMLRALAGHFAARELPWPPPASRPPTGAAAERAERLVGRGDPAAGIPACAACHGDGLTGRGDHVPGLVGLPHDYLVSQLGAMRLGIRRTGDPDCMATIAGRLPDADLAIVARWLSSRPVPPRASTEAPPAGGWPIPCRGLER